MTRPAERRTYRHYPTEYAELFMQFSRLGHARLGPFDRTTALTLRRDLYRYVGALRTAIEAEPSDSYIDTLYQSSRNARIVIIETNDEYFLTLQLNPLVAAMRRPAAED